MTNVEFNPEPVSRPGSTPSTPCVQLWPARNVPLGGVRGVTVSRTLPQRGMPTVGAWCFLDSFGPAAPNMSVLPHPHIGLQTVTWPLSGMIRHRDSLGSDVLVRPGELNLMTAGNGVAHSEFSWLGESTDDAAVGTMRGLQLWVALPEESRHRAASFEQHRELPVGTIDGLSVTVLLGELAGLRSPATTFSPIVGAQLECSARSSTVPLNRLFEHAILVLDGTLEIDGTTIPAGPLAFLGAGRAELTVRAAADSKFLLIGGEPFGEDLLMWWNFVARNQTEIEAARADWESVSQDTASARFPVVAGHGPAAGAEAGRIPAPPLPAVKLTPRRRSPQT